MIGAGMFANLVAVLLVFMLIAQFGPTLVVGVLVFLAIESIIGIYLLVKRKLADFWLGCTIIAVVLLLLVSSCFGIFWTSGLD